MDFDGEKIYKCGDSLSKIYKCGEVVWSADTGPDYSKEYLTFEILSNGVINWFPRILGHYTEIQYSKNGGDWTILTANKYYILVSAGDIVRFKGHYTAKPYQLYFSSSASYNVYGNVMSLVEGDDFEGVTDLTGKQLLHLFQDYYIRSAKNLILPATTLDYYCYAYMFQGCTGLTEAPDLPATTLASTCYIGMFNDCRSLTTAPVLPASTLVENCYYGMFYGCSNLNYIKCMAEYGMGGSNIQNWTAGVSSTGTFVKAAGVEWPTGESGIPNNWTVIED